MTEQQQPSSVQAAEAYIEEHERAWEATRRGQGVRNPCSLRGWSATSGEVEFRAGEWR